MKALDTMAQQWIMVAELLRVPNAVVNNITVARLQDDKASLRRAVEWWFKKTANPEWTTIQEICK